MKKTTETLTEFAIRRWVGIQHDRRGERGDVPGWVLITVMTAALVTALLTAARTQLTGILSTALGSVSGK